MSFLESRTIKCAERNSANSWTSPRSSSFVSTARRLCARQPVQCIAMPPMEYTDKMFRVEMLALRLMEQRVVTFFSVRLVRATAFDVEHITCDTFPPGVGSPTSACIDLWHAREL